MIPTFNPAGSTRSLISDASTSALISSPDNIDPPGSVAQKPLTTTNPKSDPRASICTDLYNGLVSVKNSITNSASRAGKFLIESAKNGNLGESLKTYAKNHEDKSYLTYANALIKVQQADVAGFVDKLQPVSTISERKTVVPERKELLALLTPIQDFLTQNSQLEKSNPLFDQVDTKYLDHTIKLLNSSNNKLSWCEFSVISIYLRCVSIEMEKSRKAFFTPEFFQAAATETQRLNKFETTYAAEVKKFKDFNDAEKVKRLLRQERFIDPDRPEYIHFSIPSEKQQAIFNKLIPQKKMAYLVWQKTHLKTDDPEYAHIAKPNSGTSYSELYKLPEQQKFLLISNAINDIEQLGLLSWNQLARDEITAHLSPEYQQVIEDPSYMKITSANPNLGVAVGSTTQGYSAGAAIGPKWMTIKLTDDERFYGRMRLCLVSLTFYLKTSFSQLFGVNFGLGGSYGYGDYIEWNDAEHTVVNDFANVIKNNQSNPALQAHLSRVHDLVDGNNAFANLFLKTDTYMEVRDLKLREAEFNLRKENIRQNLWLAGLMTSIPSEPTASVPSTTSALAITELQGDKALSLVTSGTLITAQSDLIVPADPEAEERSLPSSHFLATEQQQYANLRLTVNEPTTSAEPFSAEVTFWEFWTRSTASLTMTILNPLLSFIGDVRYIYHGLLHYRKTSLCSILSQDETDHNVLDTQRILVIDNITTQCALLQTEGDNPLLKRRELAEDLHAFENAENKKTENALLTKYHVNNDIEFRNKICLKQHDLNYALDLLNALRFYSTIRVRMANAKNGMSAEKDILSAMEKDFFKEYKASNAEEFLHNLLVLNAGRYIDVQNDMNLSDEEKSEIKVALVNLDKELLNPPFTCDIEKVRETANFRESVLFTINDRQITLTGTASSSFFGSLFGARASAQLNYITREHINPFRDGDYIDLRLTFGSNVAANKNLWDKLQIELASSGMDISALSNANIGFEVSGTAYFRFFKPRLFPQITYTDMFYRGLSEADIKFSEMFAIPVASGIEVTLGFDYLNSNITCVKDSYPSTSLLEYCLLYTHEVIFGHINKAGELLKTSIWHTIREKQRAVFEKMFAACTESQDNRIFAEINALFPQEARPPVEARTGEQEEIIAYFFHATAIYQRVVNNKPETVDEHYQVEIDTAYRNALNSFEKILLAYAPVCHKLKTRSPNFKKLPLVIPPHVKKLGMENPAEAISANTSAQEKDRVTKVKIPQLLIESDDENG